MNKKRARSPGRDEKYHLYFLPASDAGFTGEIIEIHFQGGIREACHSCAARVREFVNDGRFGQNVAIDRSLAILVDPGGKAIATISPDGHHIWIPRPLEFEAVLKSQPDALPAPGQTPSFINRGPAVAETRLAEPLKWVPPYTPPGKPDLFYINEILSALWREPDGTLPRHGNPEDPLDDLIYLMLTRRGRIDAAQQVFESLRDLVTPTGSQRPEWSRLLEETIERLSLRLNCLGMGMVRAGELHAALRVIRDQLGDVTLEPLRHWNNQRCLAFLSVLPGVGPKTAQCVMLYALRRKVFPADTHCIRVLARLGVIPLEFEDQARHKEAQKLLADGRIPPDLCYSLHVTLIRHGQEVCMPLNPRCDQCALRGLCAHYRAERHREWKAVKGAPSVIDLFAGAGGTSLGISRPAEFGNSDLTAYQQVMHNGSALLYNHVARPNNSRDLELYALN